MRFELFLLILEVLGSLHLLWHLWLGHLRMHHSLELHLWLHHWLHWLAWSHIELILQHRIVHGKFVLLYNLDQKVWVLHIGFLIFAKISQEISLLQLSDQSDQLLGVSIYSLVSQLSSFLFQFTLFELRRSLVELGNRLLNLFLLNSFLNGREFKVENSLVFFEVLENFFLLVK